MSSAFWPSEWAYGVSSSSYAPRISISLPKGLADQEIVAYEMFVLGETAQAVENGIQSLQDDPSLRASIVETLDISDSTAKSALDTLSTVLDPILHVLEETPWRAVIIAAVVRDSICVYGVRPYADY